ncbi:PREDICTED: chondroitin sulfate proteoglycan 5 [Corvus brachyrhynchos]|nr:PREDICTED: chondroitin sulfate proteoglycan 5 [Corvus brachyrhynchos]
MGIYPPDLQRWDQLTPQNQGHPTTRAGAVGGSCSHPCSPAPRRYRTPSELHNDNFSLSTIAEGSHPNDDPGAPHKLQDSLKSCLKDEEPFNIHNSTSPKHDGGKGEQDVGELNCLQNNLT